jgi:hypothetical protein
MFGNGVRMAGMITTKEHQQMAQLGYKRMTVERLCAVVAGTVFRFSTVHPLAVLENPFAETTPLVFEL